MKLIDSAKEWVLKNLPVDQKDADLVTYLNGVDVRQLFVVYHNWLSRLVKPQIRHVHISTKFEANPLRQSMKSEIDTIIDDIGKGNDLRKYLSRGIKSVVKIPGRKKLAQRADLDLMLNAQQVHHLHVSTRV